MWWFDEERAHDSRFNIYHSSRNGARRQWTKKNGEDVSECYLGIVMTKVERRTCLNMGWRVPKKWWISVNLFGRPFLYNAGAPLWFLSNGPGWTEGMYLWCALFGLRWLEVSLFEIGHISYSCTRSWGHTCRQSQIRLPTNCNLDHFYSKKMKCSVWKVTQVKWPTGH